MRQKLLELFAKILCWPALLIPDASAAEVFIFSLAGIMFWIVALSMGASSLLTWLILK